MSKTRTRKSGGRLLVSKWLRNIMPATLLLLVASQATAASGYVIFWGLGGDPNKDAGQLSSGVLSYAGEPVTDVEAVSVGFFHALALRSDGTVLGWGGNRQGQATGSVSPQPSRAVNLVRIDGQILSNVVAVAAGWNHSLALTRDGTVVGWGMEGFSGTPLRMPIGVTNLVAIASGAGYRVGVNRLGEVIDLYFGLAIPSLSNIVSVAVQKSDHPVGVALRADGSLRMFATNGFPDYATRFPGLTNVVSIACGRRHNLALTSTGSVWGWGSNGSGEATGFSNTNDPYFSSDVVQVNRQELSHVNAIAAGEDFSLALRENGTIANWGNSYNPSFAVPAGLSNVTAIAAGHRFCLAITTNAAVAKRFSH